MNIPQILHDSCGDKMGRYDLTSPYNWGDWIYATDGRIMVRCLAKGQFFALTEGRNIPDPTRFSDAGDIERIAVALPEAIGTKPCDRCDGKGKTDCYECTRCGEEQRIKIDGMTISFDCLDCDGKGTVENDEAILISESPKLYLAAHYVVLLRSHGVLAVAIPKQEIKAMKLEGKIEETVRFVGDGFDGWLMPLMTDRVEAELKASGAKP